MSDELSMRGKRPRGTPRTLTRWVENHAGRELGRFELRTFGLSDVVVVQTWAPATVVADPAAWAEEVLELAQGDADERGSMTQFSLVAVEPEGETVATFTIRRRPQGSASEDTPDPTGLVRQAQRHAELANQQMHRMMETSFGALATVMSQLIERDAAREAQRAEDNQLFRDAIVALTEAKARDDEMERDVRKDKRVDRLIQLAEMYAAKAMAESKPAVPKRPAPVAHIGGKKGQK